MDPDAAVSWLLDALTSGDPASAADLFDELVEWIDRGGYLPGDPRF